jgi:hypothetical protein
VAIAHAVQGVFYRALPVSVLIFLLAWLIKEVPLAAGPHQLPPRETPATRHPTTRPTHMPDPACQPGRRLAALGFGGA